MIIPNIIIKTSKGERLLDVYSGLLESRIIYIYGEIDSQLAVNINAQLIHLAGKSKNPISIYIHSPGGEIYSMFTIIDTIEILKKEKIIINTFCMGFAASAASIILLSGTKRYALRNSVILTHQPLGGTKGQASDILIHTKEIIRLKKLLLNMIKNRCLNKTEKDIEKIIDRDTYFTSDEAIKFGLIDEILLTFKC